MNILLLAQHYTPEDVSGAVLATELAEDLAHNGHQVAFVTCAPNYPAGRVFAGYRNKLVTEEQHNRVKVVRVWSYISLNKSFWSRIFNYGTFSLMAFFGGLKAGKPEVIFCYSPPLPLGISAWLLSRMWRVPWVLRVEDLYPEAAIVTGVLRNPVAIRFFRWLERFLYRRATHISLISEGFRRNLLSKGIAAGKLSVIPVWADPDIVRPSSKENAFRHEHGLDNTFVVLYAGALGHTSALEDVLDAAGQLLDTPSIRFVIVGEGVKKEALMQIADERHLANVQFLPFQPRKCFADMLAAADVSLVTLNAHSSSYSLPSKTFNIMASARPILAVTPLDSEIAHLIAEYQCGISVPPSQPQRLADTIRQLQDGADQLDQMGYNGRSALEMLFSRSHCIESFAQRIAQVIHEYNRSAQV